MTIAESLQAAIAHHQAGRLGEAEKMYRAILAADPNQATALHLLGMLAGQAGHFAASADLLARVVKMNPSDALAERHLGVALEQAGRLDEAVAALRRAIALRENFADAYVNLGSALGKQGKTSDALAALTRAVELEPGNAEAWGAKGLALWGANRLEEGLAALRAALEIRPGDAETYGNIGSILWVQGRMQEAISAHRRAAELQPNRAEMHNNLGNTLMTAGRFDEAIGCFCAAMKSNPGLKQAADNLMYLSYYLPDEERAIALEGELRGRFESAVVAQMPPSAARNRPGKQRLRIGYVSGDFRRHPVSSFLLPLLANHDHQRVKVICYADDRISDELTGRYKACADKWRSISGMEDSRLAEMVREDGVDILVDLAGHTAGNRLSAFARKPAPVQVTWLGFPGTTGLRAMDFRLTDALADPPGMTEPWHTERLERLPDAFLCFAAPPEAQDVEPRKSGPIVFGSFNHLPKVNTAVVDAWGRILNEVPDSRLILKGMGFGDGEIQRRIWDRLAAAGIAERRVDIVERLPKIFDHFRLYDRVDIALDTFPYNGTATTCEALWMAVPVVALAGRRHVSRVGVSILSNVGLTELIGASVDDYVRMAVQLAGDQGRLAAYRETLRQRMRGSALMDAPRFARNVEAAYQRMWGAA